MELGDDGGEGDHPNWAELIVFLKPATKLGETILKKVKVFWVDIVDCFVLNVAVLDKACVAKDLDMEK